MRPPERMTSAAASMTRAISGRARFTASATVWSSRLMISAISSADLVSRSRAESLRCSVERVERSGMLSVFHLRLPERLEPVLLIPIADGEQNDAEGNKADDAISGIEFDDVIGEDFADGDRE